MFEFFSKIIGFISSVWDYFINFIESLVQAVAFLVSSSAFAVALIGYMPGIIGTAIVVFLAVFIVKFLIGR